METVNTYLAPGSIDVATLIVGAVFLLFFIVAASLLARHHLGILTAIVGAGVWLLSGRLLARQGELVGFLAPRIGAAQTRLDLGIAQSAQRFSPWVTALGLVIAIGALILHRVEAAATPPFVPLEDQHHLPDPMAHEPHEGPQS